MRQEPATRLLRLAQQFAAESTGISLEEIAVRFGVSRRTAERMRDAVAEVFPQLEEIDGERPKRWRLPSGFSGIFREPLAEELAVLRGIARKLQREDKEDTAELLSGVANKIEASLKPARRRKLAPDVEALMETEGFASRPRPRLFIARETFALIRRAILEGRCLAFSYRSEAAVAPVYREVVPYGVLYGQRVYLVAAFPWETGPVNYRLDRVTDLRVTDKIGVRPCDFGLDAYAARSFGSFQEDPYDVVLRFAPEVADEVAAFQFHQSQTVTREPDGSMLVRFRAGGLREMALHLITWRQTVKIEKPEELRSTMLELIEASRSSL